MTVHHERTVMPTKTDKQLADEKFLAACAALERALTGEDPTDHGTSGIDPDDLRPSNNEGPPSNADIFYDGNPRF